MAAAVPADLIEGRFLAEEHRRLRDGLAVLQDSIAACHQLTRPEVMDRVARTLAWLRRDLLAHASWEDAWLYPRLDQQADTAWATRALGMQHEQIRELAIQLEKAFETAHERWSTDVAFNLATALARLDALISSHVAQEERFIPSLLEYAEAS
jgi:iron-sulfur cluster repair protein YtfE (RIC family)